MKFTFTRKNNEPDYEAFNGDDEYYRMDDSEDMMANDGNFGMGSLHTENASAPFASASNNTTAALKIVNPKAYDEAPTIADFILNGNTVLLNIEGLDRNVAIRLLDYISGAIHMVGGIMTKVGKTTIVVAPRNVDVSSIEAMVGGNN